jgi:hypothetical protein
MAPDKGLSSSFKRNVPLDLNKSYPWGKPCDVFPIKRPEMTDELRELRDMWAGMVRRVVPGLIAQDICSVQPMTGAIDPLFTWFKENPGKGFYITSGK